MKKYVLLFALLFVPLFASGQDTTLPYPISHGLGQSGNTCVFPGGVTSGDVLVVSTGWYNAANTPSVSDTVGTSYSQAALYTAGGGGGVDLAVYVGTAAGTGANTVTMSVSGASFQQVECTELKNGTTTVDAALTGTSSLSTITTSALTTTVGQDYLLCFVAGFNNAGVIGPTYPMLPLGYTHGSDSTMAAWRLTGANGSNTCSFTNTNANVTYALVALKPAASFTVATIALPDAAAGTDYAYTLQGMGGTGSYTCAKTSGTFPLGMSLSGCTITGNPSAGAADSSLAFQLTDGSSTTANSSTLNLHLGNSLQTMSLLQSNSSTGAATKAFSSNVTAGSCLVITASGGPSMFNPSDTRGTVYRPVTSFMLPATGPDLTGVWIGKAPSSGADTVSGGAGSTVYSIKEYGNCQGDFVDFGDVTTGTGGSTLTSNNSTTLVPNTTIDAVLSEQSGSYTASASSPMTQVNSVVNALGAVTDGYQLASTAGTYSSSFSTNAGSVLWGIAQIGLRPSVTGTAPTAGGPRHHAQVY